MVGLLRTGSLMVGLLRNGQSHGRFTKNWTVSW